MIIPNVDKMIMQALDIKTSLGSALGREPLLDKPGRFWREGRGTAMEKVYGQGGSGGPEWLRRIAVGAGWIKGK